MFNPSSPYHHSTLEILHCELSLSKADLAVFIHQQQGCQLGLIDHDLDR